MFTDHASALVGQTARLRCRIDGKSCGEMHSIKWYKADTRVYVYSASKDAAINRPEGEMMKRFVNFIIYKGGVFSVIIYQIAKLLLSTASLRDVTDVAFGQRKKMSPLTFP